MNNVIARLAIQSPFNITSFLEEEKVELKARVDCGIELTFPPVAVARWIRTISVSKDAVTAV